MKQEDSRAWAHKMAAGIGQAVRLTRTRRGLSAEQLSARCAQLGQAIPRNTIANLENGRKESVPVHELVVLARALEVPPVELLYPVGRAATVEALPGWEEDPLIAAEWFCGNAGPTEGDTAVNLYREFVVSMEGWLDFRDRVNAGGPDEVADRGMWKRLLQQQEDAIRRLLARCQQIGIDPPRLDVYGEEIAAYIAAEFPELLR